MIQEKLHFKLGSFFSHDLIRRFRVSLSFCVNIHTGTKNYKPTGCIRQGFFSSIRTLKLLSLEVTSFSKTKEKKNGTLLYY